VSTISLVVAAAENGVIGHRGALPWRLPEDLKRFKALTMGKPVIMGRKTWDSLPKRPLPGRTNIVVTRNRNFGADGALVAHNFADALAQADAGEVMVIGGEAIFSEALPLADTIHLTEVAASPEGDAFMPPIDRGEWREIAREGPYEANGLAYSFVTLTRSDVVKEPKPEDFLELLRLIDEAKRKGDRGT
jgi:dihydrofolate reductase